MLRKTLGIPLFSNLSLLTQSVLLWFGFLALAFLNGALREVMMIQSLGMPPHSANQLSCLTGIALWTTLLALAWGKMKICKLREAIAVGLGWFTATMLFETFVINRGLSWAQILQPYDLSAGEYWGLVLLWIGGLPVTAYELGRRRRNGLDVIRGVQTK